MRRNRRFLIIFFLIWILPAIPASADSFSPQTFEGIRHGLIAGDSKAVCDALISLVEKNPLEPYAALMYPDIINCAEITGFERIDNLLSKNLEQVIHKGNTSAALSIRLFREQLRVKYYSEKQLPDDSFLPFVRSWELAQYENRLGAGDLYGSGQIRTESIVKNINISDDGPSGWIMPSRYLHRQTGMIRARTGILTSQPVRIRIMSANRYGVRINNHDILLNDGLDKRNIRVISVSGTDMVSLEIMFSDSEEIDFRVLVTDESDRPVNPRTVDSQKFYEGGVLKEIENYPWSEISAAKNGYPEWAFNLLKGIYLESCESDSAATAYMLSLEQRPDPVTGFFLASVLVSGEKGRSSERWRRGWSYISKLASSETKFAPATWKTIEAEMEDGDFERVYTQAGNFLSRYPGYMPAWTSFLPYLSSRGCDREFRDNLIKFRNMFPQSQLASIFAAYHLRERDPEQYNSMMLSLLKERVPEIYMQDLVKNLSEAGQYNKVCTILQSPGRDVKHEDDLYDILFRMKDFTTLRTLLLKRAGVFPRPSVFLRLGLLDRLKGGDGLHFLKAAQEQDRSLFGIRDYTAYCSEGDYSQIYNFSENPDFSEKSGDEEKDSDTTTPVLSRNWFFELEENGSRVFIRELIRINTPEDIERYGEYNVPFQGEVIPLEISVKGREGLAADSYRITRINDKTYITINGLEIGSRLYISLMVKDPLRKASDSC